MFQFKGRNQQYSCTTKNANSTVEQDIKWLFGAAIFCPETLAGLSDAPIVAFSTGTTTVPRDIVPNGSLVAIVVNLSLFEVTTDLEPEVEVLDSSTPVLVAVSAVTRMLVDILDDIVNSVCDLPCVGSGMSSRVLSVALTTTPVGIGIVATPPPGDSTSTPRSPSEMTTLEIVAASPPCDIVCDPTTTVFPPGAAEITALATVPRLNKVFVALDGMFKSGNRTA